MIAPASARPRALLLRCSPWPCLPRWGDRSVSLPAGQPPSAPSLPNCLPFLLERRAEAISYSYVVSEIPLFFVLFCSAGAVFERRCQRLCFAWAEHLVGASHRRKRLQKAFPHIFRGSAALVRGFSRSEALPAASHFGRLLQLHLFGGICLGTGLGPPLCRS